MLVPRPTRLVLVAVTLAVAATGCGVKAPEPVQPRQPQAQAQAPGTVVATARATGLPVFSSMSAARPFERLSARTAYGSPRVVDVTQEHGDWLQVLLPHRPPRSSGWVRRADVTLSRTAYRVVVSLSARRLTLYDGASALWQRPVAVGASRTPTPRGRFFVTDVVKVERSQASYGPYALGLSGYSPTLREFAGGDAQVALHGTDRPALLGSAVSHGCVRTSNPTIAALARVLPLGAPVEVVA